MLDIRYLSLPISKIKNLISVFLLSALFFSLSANVEARFFLSDGESGAQFLTIPIAARPQALGNSYVAMSKDVHVLEHNPAGLSFIADKQFSVSHLFLFRNSNYTSLSYAHETIDNFGFGFRYRSFYANDTARSLAGVSTGKFQVKDDGITVAGSVKFREMLSLGVSTEYVDRQLAGFGSRGLVFGFGVQYLHPSKRHAYGAALLNFGESMRFEETAEPLPTLARVGGAHALGRTLLSDKNEEEAEIGKGFIFNWSVLRYRDDFDFTASAGVEWWIYNPFAARAGFQLLGNEFQATAGFGLLWKSLGIDFAVRSLKELGMVNSLTVLVRF